MGRIKGGDIYDVDVGAGVDDQVIGVREGDIRVEGRRRLSQGESQVEDKAVLHAPALLSVWKNPLK